LTPIYVGHWTSREWTQDFYSYVKAVLLRSIERQCKTKLTCPSMKQFHLFIRVAGESENNKFTLERKRNVNITIVRGPKVMQQYLNIMKYNILHHMCKWLSTIYIDADDAFLDGYFDYVTSMINNVLQTKTEDGFPWRGAVFAARALPRLVVGKNRCFINKDAVNNFYSGLSQGQGFILRTNVWQAMKMPWIPRLHHLKFLKNIRQTVMHHLGFKTYKSNTLGRWHSTPSQIEYERKDAAESRIIFVDVSVDGKSTAIFLQTPFSSHFLWEKLGDLPICDKQQQRIIQREFPQDIMYYLSMADSLNQTKAVACLNNKFLNMRYHGNCE